MLGRLGLGEREAQALTSEDRIECISLSASFVPFVPFMCSCQIEPCVLMRACAPDDYAHPPLPLFAPNHCQIISHPPLSAAFFYFIFLPRLLCLPLAPQPVP